MANTTFLSLCWIPKVLERLKAGEELRDEDLAKLEITYGYSRDNRPQARQINLIMATAWTPGMAEALPVYAYPFSGNANDISEFPAFIANSAAMLKGLCPNLNYMVCDSSGATYKAASACREAGLHLITRLPDSTTAVQEAFKKAKNGQVKWKELVMSGGDE